MAEPVNMADMLRKQREKLAADEAKKKEAAVKPVAIPKPVEVRQAGAPVARPAAPELKGKPAKVVSEVAKPLVKPEVPKPPVVKQKEEKLPEEAPSDEALLKTVFGDPSDRIPKYELRTADMPPLGQQAGLAETQALSEQADPEGVERLRIERQLGITLDPEGALIKAEENPGRVNMIQRVDPNTIPKMIKAVRKIEITSPSPKKLIAALNKANEEISKNYTSSVYSGGTGAAEYRRAVMNKFIADAARWHNKSPTQYIMDINKTYPDMNFTQDVMQAIGLPKASMPTSVETIAADVMEPINQVLNVATTGRALPDQFVAPKAEAYTPKARMERATKTADTMKRMGLADPVELKEIDDKLEMGIYQIPTAGIAGGGIGGTPTTSLPSTRGADATAVASELLKTAAANIGDEQAIMRIINQNTETGAWLEAKKEIATKLLPVIKKMNPELSEDDAGKLANRQALRLLAAARNTGQWNSPIYINREDWENGELKVVSMPNPANDIEIIGVSSNGQIISRQMTYAAALANAVTGSLEYGVVGGVRTARQMYNDVESAGITYQRNLAEGKSYAESATAMLRQLESEDTWADFVKNTQMAAATQADLITDAATYAEKKQLSTLPTSVLVGVALAASVFMPDVGEVGLAAKERFVGDFNRQSILAKTQTINPEWVEPVNATMDALLKIPGMDYLSLGSAAAPLRTLDSGVDAATRGQTLWFEGKRTEAIEQFAQAEAASESILRNQSSKVERDVEVKNADGSTRIEKQFVDAGTGPLIMETVDRLEGEITRRVIENRGGSKNVETVVAANDLYDYKVANALNRLGQAVANKWSMDVNLSNLVRRTSTQSYATRFGVASDLKALTSFDAKAVDAAILADLSKTEILRGIADVSIRDALKDFDFKSLLDVDAKDVPQILYDYLQANKYDFVSNPKSLAQLTSDTETLLGRVKRESEIGALLADKEALVNRAINSVVLQREIRTTASAVTSHVARRTGGKQMSVASAETEALIGANNDLRLSEATRVAGERAASNKVGIFDTLMQKYGLRPDETKLSATARSYLPKIESMANVGRVEAIALATLADARAKTWSDITGRPIDEWWRTRISDIRTVRGEGTVVAPKKLGASIPAVDVRAEKVKSLISALTPLLGDKKETTTIVQNILKDRNAVMLREKAGPYNKDVSALYWSALRAHNMSPLADALHQPWDAKSVRLWLTPLTSNVDKVMVDFAELRARFKDEASLSLYDILDMYTENTDFEMSNGTPFTQSAIYTEIIRPRKHIGAEKQYDQKNSYFDLTSVDTQSLVTAVMQRRKEGNSTAPFSPQEVIAHLETEQTSMLTRQIIAGMKPLLNADMKVYICSPREMSAIFPQAPKNIATSLGAYFSAIDGRPEAVWINSDNSNFGVGPIIVHELMHSITVQTLRMPTTQAQKTFATTIETLYFAALDNIPGAEQAHYGLTNKYEFIAEIFANPDFCDLLNTVKLPSKKTIWTDFLDALIRLFGLDTKDPTILSETVKTISTFITTEAKVKKTKPEIVPGVFKYDVWGNRLYSTEAETLDARGSVEFDPRTGAALIEGYARADATTFVHELAHVIRSELSPSDMDRLVATLNDEYGIEVGHDNQGNFVDVDSPESDDASVIVEDDSPTVVAEPATKVSDITDIKDTKDTTDAEEKDPATTVMSDTDRAKAATARYNARKTNALTNPIIPDKLVKTTPEAQRKANVIASSIKSASARVEELKAELAEFDSNEMKSTKAFKETTKKLEAAEARLSEALASESPILTARVAYTKADAKYAIAKNAAEKAVQSYESRRDGKITIKSGEKLNDFKSKAEEAIEEALVQRRALFETIVMWEDAMKVEAAKVSPSAEAKVTAAQKARQELEERKAAEAEKAAKKTIRPKVDEPKVEVKVEEPVVKEEVKAEVKPEELKAEEPKSDVTKVEEPVATKVDLTPSNQNLVDEAPVAEAVTPTSTEETSKTKKALSPALAQRNLDSAVAAIMRQPPFSEIDANERGSAAARVRAVVELMRDGNASDMAGKAQYADVAEILASGGTKDEMIEAIKKSINEEHGVNISSFEHKTKTGRKLFASTPEEKPKKRATKAKATVQEAVAEGATSGKTVESTPIKFKGDIGRLADILTSTMQHQDIVSTVEKELIQNALYATKAKHFAGGYPSGKKGMITHEVTESWTSTDIKITVAEDGIGMSPETVDKAFFTLGSSNQTLLPMNERPGGYGVAKATILFFADKIELTTTKDNVTTHITATKEQLDALKNGTGSLIPTITKSRRKIPSGTRVTVTLPKQLKDEYSGKQISLRHNSSELERLLLPNEYADMTTNVTAYGGQNLMDTGVNAALRSAKILAEGTNGVVGARIKEFPRPADGYYSRVYVFSNGAFQFQKYLSLEGRTDYILEVKADVPPGHPEYPFNPARSDFSVGAKDVMSDLTSVLSARGEAKAKNEDLQNPAASWVTIGSTLTPVPIKTATTKDKVISWGSIAIPIPGAPTLPELDISDDPKVRLLVNQLGVPFEYKPFSHPVFGEVTLRTIVDDYTTAVQRAVHSVAPEIDTKLAQYNVGALFSTTVGGMHINPEALRRKINRMILMNPVNVFGTKPPKTPFAYAAQQTATLVHEITHFLQSGHNEAFTSTEPEVAIALGETGGKEFQEAMQTFFVTYAPFIEQLRTHYEDITTQRRNASAAERKKYADKDLLGTAARNERAIADDIRTADSSVPRSESTGNRETGSDDVTPGSIRSDVSEGEGGRDGNLRKSEGIAGIIAGRLADTRKSGKLFQSENVEIVDKRFYKSVLQEALTRVFKEAKSIKGISLLNQLKKVPGLKQNELRFTGLEQKLTALGQKPITFDEAMNAAANSYEYSLRIEGGDADKLADFTRDGVELFNDSYDRTEAARDSVYPSGEIRNVITAMVDIDDHLGTPQNLQNTAVPLYRLYYDLDAMLDDAVPLEFASNQIRVAGDLVIPVKWQLFIESIPVEAAAVKKLFASVPMPWNAQYSPATTWDLIMQAFDDINRSTSIEDANQQATNYLADMPEEKLTYTKELQQFFETNPEHVITKAFDVDSIAELLASVRSVTPLEEKKTFIRNFLNDAIAASSQASYRTYMLPGTNEVNLLLDLDNNPNKEGTAIPTPTDAQLAQAEALANTPQGQAMMNTQQAANTVTMHFGKDNLAHARGNTQIVNGKKYFFLQEIQSDIMQAIKAGKVKKPIRLSHPDTADWTQAMTRAAIKYAVETGHEGIILPDASVIMPYNLSLPKELVGDEKAIQAQLGPPSTGDVRNTRDTYDGASKYYKTVVVDSVKKDLGVTTKEIILPKFSQRPNDSRVETEVDLWQRPLSTNIAPVVQQVNNAEIIDATLTETLQDTAEATAYHIGRLEYTTAGAMFSELGDLSQGIRDQIQLFADIENIVSRRPVTQIVEQANKWLTKKRNKLLAQENIISYVGTYEAIDAKLAKIREIIPNTPALEQLKTMSDKEVSGFRFDTRKLPGDYNTFLNKIFRQRSLLPERGVSAETALEAIEAARQEITEQQAVLWQNQFGYGDIESTQEFITKYGEENILQIPNLTWDKITEQDILQAKTAEAKTLAQQLSAAVTRVEQIRQEYISSDEKKAQSSISLQAIDFTPEIREKYSKPQPLFQPESESNVNKPGIKLIVDDSKYSDQVRKAEETWAEVVESVFANKELPIDSPPIFGQVADIIRAYVSDTARSVQGMMPTESVSSGRKLLQSDAAPVEDKRFFKSVLQEALPRVFGQAKQMKAASLLNQLKRVQGLTRNEMLFTGLEQKLTELGQKPITLAEANEVAAKSNEYSVRIRGGIDGAEQDADIYSWKDAKLSLEKNWGLFALPGKNYTELALDIPTTLTSTKTLHFGQGNLAHLRGNRQMINDKPYFFIQEIQSDLMQNIAERDVPVTGADTPYPRTSDWTQAMLRAGLRYAVDAGYEGIILPQADIIMAYNFKLPALVGDADKLRQTKDGVAFSGADKYYTTIVTPIAASEIGATPQDAQLATTATKMEEFRRKRDLHEYVMINFNNIMSDFEQQRSPKSANRKVIAMLINKLDDAVSKLRTSADIVEQLAPTLDAYTAWAAEAKARNLDTKSPLFTTDTVFMDRAETIEWQLKKYRPEVTPITLNVKTIDFTPEIKQKYSKPQPLFQSKDAPESSEAIFRQFMEQFDAKTASSGPFGKVVINPSSDTDLKSLFDGVDLTNPMAAQEAMNTRLKAIKNELTNFPDRQPQDLVDEQKLIERRLAAIKQTPEYKTALLAELKATLAADLARYGNDIPKAVASKLDKLRKKIDFLEKDLITQDMPTPLPFSGVQSDEALNLSAREIAKTVPEKTVSDKFYQQMVNSPKWSMIGGFLTGFGADEKWAQRSIPPEARSVFMTAVRPIQETISDISRLITEGSENLASTKQTLIEAAVTGDVKAKSVFEYLNGRQIKFGSGMPSVTSGVNHVDWAVARIQSKWHGMDIADQNIVQRYFDACGVDANGNVKTYVSGLDNNTASAAAAILNKLLVDADKSDARSAAANPGDLFIGMAKQSVWPNIGVEDAPKLHAWLMSLFHAAEVIEPTNPDAGFIPNPDQAIRLVSAMSYNVSSNIEAPHHAAVWLATHGGLQHSRNAIKNQAFGVPKEDAGMFDKWKRGQYDPKMDYAKMDAIARKYGLTATFELAPELGINDVMLPSKLRAEIRNELLHGRRLLTSEEQLALQFGADPQKIFAGEYKADFITSTIGSIVMGIRKSKVLGLFFNRPQGFTNDTIGIYDAVASNSKFKTAAATTIQRSLQLAITNTPFLSDLLDALGLLARFTGSNNNVAKIQTKIRRALSNAGDNVSKAMISASSAARNLPLVTEIIDGSNEKFLEVNGTRYSHYDLRQIWLQEGVFATFERGQTSEALFNEVTPKTGLSLEKRARRAANTFSRYRYEQSNEAGTFVRVGVASAYLQMGYDPRTAARAAVATTFDYVNSTTGWDKNLIYNIFFPFQAFRKNNARFIMNRLTTYDSIRKVAMTYRLLSNIPDALEAIAIAEQREDGNEYGVKVNELNEDAREEFNQMRLILEEGYSPMFGTDIARWPDSIKTHIAGSPEAFTAQWQSMDEKGKNLLVYGYRGYDNVPLDIKQSMNMFFSGATRIISSDQPSMLDRRKLLADENILSNKANIPVDEDAFASRTRFMYDYQLNRPSATFSIESGPKVDALRAKSDAQSNRTRGGTGTDTTPVIVGSLAETMFMSQANVLGVGMALATLSYRAGETVSEGIFDATDEDLARWKNNPSGTFEESDVEPDRASPYYSIGQFFDANAGLLKQINDPERTELLGDVLKMQAGEERAAMLHPLVGEFFASVPGGFGVTVDTSGVEPKYYLTPEGKLALTASLRTFPMELSAMLLRSEAIIDAFRESPKTQSAAAVQDAINRGDYADPATVLYLLKSAGFQVNEQAPSSVISAAQPRWSEQSSTPR